ncbi:sigma-54-dependent transcriptional regulator [Vogesella indigofera]|uniref:Sigma-54 dependent transcriptional regulator n=1 Tax=Vogesella indigofera TaxID=45465 RepID=A0ABT5I256_VOGIN|nr:sigma-54 dependent transcriptional regulator [Vogesella indigofera]MDC7690257.1 sigma-54 dependent transcriptional regulator [Vogesella indigofera]
MQQDETLAASGNAAAKQWDSYSVLVVDDEPGMVNFIKRALESRCGSVHIAGSVEAAEPLVAQQRFDLIVLDISLPGMSGVNWLKLLRERGVNSEVILMTAFADVETAIDALRAGASDFLLKPFSLAQLINAARRAFERARLEAENWVLRREVASHASRSKVSRDGLIGHSAAITELRGLLQRFAPMPSTVLIQGESGTGKEVVARALHQLSPRANASFVPVNCAAITQELIESELFGHLKGAYTGAAASRDGLFYYARGGTLFLDEVAELLRVLEERSIRPVGSEQEIKVDVRVIAASNKPLADEVAAGRFRADLYYRLQVLELALPPLRERTEDLPELVAHFMDLLSPALGVAPVEVEPALLVAMAAYDWPGNVRELKNLIERSLILGYLPQDLPATRLPPAVGELAAGAVPAEESLSQVETRHIRAVLAACAGNKSEAARRLGISRKTLERKCLSWGE